MLTPSVVCGLGPAHSTRSIMTGFHDAPTSLRADAQPFLLKVKAETPALLTML